MLAYGNGNPEVCTRNLLLIGRGEVPYDRIKGIGGVIDEPFTQGELDLLQESDWLIRTYEPRVDVNDITIQKQDDNGVIINRVHADITVKERSKK